MEISNELKNDLLSRKGMLSMKTMSEQTKVNRWTLTDVMNGTRTSVRPLTYNRLNNWIERGKAACK